MDYGSACARARLQSVAGATTGCESTCVVLIRRRSSSLMGLTYSKPTPRSRVYDDVVRRVLGDGDDDGGALAGTTVAVTGCTSGLGFVIAKTCAERGATVYMLNRPSARAVEAVEAVGRGARGVDCDLTSFASTREAAANVMKQSGGVVDVLVLNAGVMALPFDATPSDGYDVQMQTNVISHWLLTRELFPALRASSSARVVSQSSLAAKMSSALRKECFEKVPMCTSWAKSTWDIYGQTKLSNLVFTEALQTRLDAAKITNVKAVAAHPGIAATELQVTTANNPGRGASSFQLALLGKSGIFQSEADGATPALVAAFDASVEGGDFFGPSRMFQCKGAPKKVPKDKKVTPQACDILWSGCEAATGVSFNL